MTIEAGNNTQYGSAANGMSYNGRTVGSGWDVRIKRESPHVAIVNVMSPNGNDDYLGILDVEPDQDLQALAIETANFPDFSSGWLCSDQTSGQEWENLAARWDAIDVA